MNNALSLFNKYIPRITMLNFTYIPTNYLTELSQTFHLFGTISNKLFTADPLRSRSFRYDTVIIIMKESQEKH